MKRGYALLITLLFVVLLSFISIQLLQNKAFFSQITTLKYFELQAIIHKEKALKYFNTKNSFENFNLNDDRFLFQSDILENNATIFSIKAKNQPIRLVYTIGN